MGFSSVLQREGQCAALDRCGWPWEYPQLQEAENLLSLQGVRCRGIKGLEDRPRGRPARKDPQGTALPGPLTRSPEPLPMTVEWPAVAEGRGQPSLCCAKST